MPTTTKTRSNSRSKSGSKRSSKGRSKKTSTDTKVLHSVRRHLGDQITDVYGVGLILLGVLTGLGMYAAKAGAVGATFDALFRGTFGVIGYAAPPLLAYAGMLLVGNGTVEEKGRRTIGLVLIVAAVVAGWHLIAGAPEPADGIRELWPAGGVAGWALSRPLEVSVGRWGAFAVVGAALFLGLLIFTKTPLSTVGRAIRRAFGAVADWFTAQLEEPGVTAEAGGDDARETQRVTKPEVDAGDDAGGDEPTERAVLQLEDDGSTAVGEAGRAPAPPKPDPSSNGKKDVDATQIVKATKIKPSESGWGDYVLPPLDLLRYGQAATESSVKRHTEAQAKALQATFEQFGIDATVARMSRGPTVTRFEVELGPGVQVKKVSSLSDDIAYALAAPDVRIVAPIPGKSAIGVEVPNRERDRIALRDVLDTEEGERDPHPLRVALGVDIAGHPALVNLTTMPHLLISGATGAGKSVTLNCMITSIVLRSKPDQVRMILIDPKRVELNHYDGIPHLLTPVVTDPKKAAQSLEWIVKEMEQRYEMLAMLGYRNIDNYNQAIADGTIEQPVSALEDGDPDKPVYRHMPYIVVVIDELADLMLVAPRDVEDAICRIAQMARAVGIHLIIATQRPSVDVITGLIKANIPSRLALAVASQTDSRTILDQGGAEKLVGHGDMLFLPSSQGKPSRLQGCIIVEDEIDTIVEFCRQQRRADYVDGVQQGGTVEPDEIDLDDVSADDDDELLMLKAMDLVVRSQLGSTSMLQRKLRIGFARAGRLMDELEEKGVVGPVEGSKAREVLWTIEDLEEELGSAS